MPAIKYSRQRESIKRYLASTREHPTADTVYTEVKKDFPNISLGTVYRNLNLLTELGEAIKISTPDGGDRFDGITEPHCHFFCKECGSVLDIDMPEKVLLTKWLKKILMDRLIATASCFLENVKNVQRSKIIVDI